MHGAWAHPSPCVQYFTIKDARRMGVPIIMRSSSGNAYICTTHGRTAINAFIIRKSHIHARRGVAPAVAGRRLSPPSRPCAVLVGLAQKNTRSPFGGGAVGSGWVTFWLWYIPLPVRSFRCRSIARSLSCVRMIYRLARGRYGCYGLL